MRSTWTDSRLDDLNGRVARIEVKIDAMDDRLTGRIDALQQTILDLTNRVFAGFIALFVAILGLIAAQIGLIVTHL